MPMKKIKYFKFSEFVKTDSGIKNCPTDFDCVRNIIKLAEYLDYIRGLLGSPIRVNSGYRNEEVNRAVGGVSNSYHLYGRACDISCSAFRFKELGDILQRAKERGEIIEFKKYPNYYHFAL